jgi:anionic cell wall polymer biosynthesis LytR-Cps2A-Psr (LCP) family protein/TM2 domain-containing membrane protein YozV
MTNKSPTLAALLSFVFPGLGQIYAGQIRKGVIWAIPMLLIILGAGWLLFGGQNRLVALVTGSNNQVALLIFNVAFFLYHVAAMIDAYDVARSERHFGYSKPRGAPIALAALVAIAIMIHGFPEVYGIDAHNTWVSIFGGGHDVVPTFVPNTPNPSYVAPTDAPTPSPDPSATASGSGEPSGPPTGSPTGTPAPHLCPPAPDLSGWSPADDGRLNLLLIGGDSRSDTGLDAKSLRTDSMILLSVDIASCKGALFSFPRNLCTAANGSCGLATRYPDWLKLPLPDEDLQSPQAQAAFPNGAFEAGGQNYPCPGIQSDGLLTSLWHIAAWCDSIFAGSDGISGNDCQEQFTCDRAWRALIGTIQNFTGQGIDGVVAVNLNGFVDLVNNLPAQCPTAEQSVTMPDTPNCYGGLWLYTDALQDDAYFNSQQQKIPVNFTQGCHYVDAEYALAYARSRHADSDYQRERRQQYVLQQVRRQLDPLQMLPNIPSLLQIAQANLYTSFSDTDVQYLAQVANRVDADRLYQEDFASAHVVTLGSMQGISDFVTNIFSQPEPQPQPQQQNNPCPPK